MAQSEILEDQVEEKSGAVHSYTVYLCPRWICRPPQSKSALAAFVPILMAFLISLANVSSVTASELICLKGISGFPGATFPKGDIFLRPGDTLEVFCTMNLSHPIIAKDKYNASNIEFKFKKHEIPRELIQTTVLNSTTAMARVQNMNASAPKLECEIPRSSDRPIPICENEVHVGFAPLEVENFRCIAIGWRSMKCTWDAPYNPIPTTYKLSHLFKTSVRVCPPETEKLNSCQWGPYTEPHYLPNIAEYHFRLNGTNPLKPSGTTWDYTVNHFSIVVPQTPDTIEAKAVSPRRIRLNWTFPSFERFDPGLFHRITVCAAEGYWCNTTMLETTKAQQKTSLVKEIDVPFAFLNYSVNISMRSQTARDTEEFWSPPAMATVTTLAAIPDAPPDTDIGSFEDLQTSLERRDVYVYWNLILRTRHNGPQFAYNIAVYEENQLSDTFRPSEITQSYAKFKDLKLSKTYRFEIHSQNANGRSLHNSQVSVPSISKAPGPPDRVSMLDFTNGTIEISWLPPKNSDAIVSYTVFRCNSMKPRPYQCSGTLEWDKVPAHQYKIEYPHPQNDSYQYAVSANTENFSSGMLWATCTLIHNKVPDKLKNVKSVNTTSDSITIEWLLDCSYRPGTVKGFKITYCLVDAKSSESCTGNENYTAAEGADKTFYHLKNLNPYTTYMISVSVMTAAGESQKSVPIYERTAQGIPTESPSINVTAVTNITAALTITAPQSMNGVLHEYLVHYKPLSSSDIPKEKKVIVDANVPEHLMLTGLVSNTKYSVWANACTRIGCSPDSSPESFTTAIGATQITTIPALNIRDGTFVLEWELPNHVGGPLKYFEIMLRQNGEVVDTSNRLVDFRNDSSRYEETLEFSCDKDTNLTAQIRVATINSNNDIILGAWSPEGKYSCAGGSVWFLWLIFSIVAIFILVAIGFLSVKLYHYIKDSSKIEVKLPPGLAVSDLNGFSHKHNTKRVRKSSGGDTEPYGKENLTYQLQITSSQMDDSKDFLSNDSNPTEAGKCLGLDDDPATSLGKSTELTTLTMKSLDSVNIESETLRSGKGIILSERKATDLEMGDVITNAQEASQSSPETDPTSNENNPDLESPAVVVNEHEINPVALSNLSKTLVPNAQPFNSYNQNETQNPNLHAGAIWWQATPTSDGDNTSPVLIKSRILPMTELNFERRLSLIHADSFQRFSPSASNPLLSEMNMNGDAGGEGSGTDEEDQNTPNYKMLGLIANGSANGVDSDNESEMMQMINPSSMLFANDSYALSNGVDNAESTEKAKTVPNGLMANGPSYVKWRQLIPELKNGDTADRSSPYCQVGILLDSS